ncbi:amino acid adenylation domain-containing protein [Streptomyces sp. NBC_01622]|uniref:amino acid adenylation domain-containing protein n=1 Tax=Streptomyces sp. NBC_01622 TaxID=2975903 RepID=UPI00386F03DF|nr:amino acid adenylation domain-containing protein [Streptomyces sp. NBC_01622]
MDRISCDEKAVSIHRRINQTAQPYPSHDSLKDLFEKCAARYADAVAVVHRDRRLTYRSLNGLANEVAARLLEAGVRTGDTVGVCVERSPELIGALLAVLKCGAAYLPVDVSWPDQRLRAVLRAAGCRLVLGDQATALAERLPDQRIVSVQGGEETSLQHSNPVTRVGPDDIAYINFTSGSTGRPKGVPIRHRSVARLVFGARYARMGDDSVVLHASPVSFDAATFEIWGPLLHGGTCVLYPASFIRLSELRRVLADQGVTLVFLTTALFNTVVDEAPDALSGVRTILTGGEAHSISHIGKALAHYGPDRLVSVYGPTECTTFATCYPVRQLPPAGTALPIGQPIQNTRMYVVANKRLCAPGEIGEVWLAGPGLSPGYLDQLGHTSDPFDVCDIDGRCERIYRTGDRGYLLEDGNVVFQGRLDHQVKVNGFRVEIGEVSHHLDQDPTVKQSYVTVTETRSGGKVLVAFVVPEGEHCTPSAVREKLSARLPDYMIPSAIHLCGALPLTTTGKVDRRTLLTLHHPFGVSPS